MRRGIWSSALSDCADGIQCSRATKKQHRRQRLRPLRPRDGPRAVSPAMIGHRGQSALDHAMVLRRLAPRPLIFLVNAIVRTHYLERDCYMHTRHSGRIPAAGMVVGAHKLHSKCTTRQAHAKQAPPSRPHRGEGDAHLHSKCTTRQAHTHGLRNGPNTVTRPYPICSHLSTIQAGHAPQLRFVWESSS